MPSSDAGVRYALWNNKGGVGKTLLSFMLSSEYASRHPDRVVIVADLCPQANLSEMVLGGNSDGSRHLAELIRKGKTIGAYFNSRIKSPHGLTGQETEFFVHASDHNSHMPENVRLVAGDPRLEIQAQVINQIGNQPLPEDSWRNVHSWLIDLVVAGERKFGDAVTFVDCNPSFAAYTEIALLAATRLVVPCTSDGSSARAVDNLAALLYGHGLPDDMRAASFSARAEQAGMPRPVVHSVLLNRSTQYDKKASKAFRAMFEEIKARTDAFRRKDPSRFHTGFDHHDIPDAHSPAIVCSHRGLPIGRLKPGDHQVHDVRPQVNREPLERYKGAIGRLVGRL